MHNFFLTNAYSLVILSKYYRIRHFLKLVRKRTYILTKKKQKKILTNAHSLVILPTYYRICHFLKLVRKMTYILKILLFFTQELSQLTSFISKW